MFPKGGDRQIEIELQEVFGVHFKIRQKSLIDKQCTVYKGKKEGSFQRNANKKYLTKQWNEINREDKIRIFIAIS